MGKGCETEALACLVVRQLEQQLIADERHPHPVEGGAIGDYVRLNPAVREAARPEREVERELQGIARLERSLEVTSFSACTPLG